MSGTIVQIQYSIPHQENLERETPRTFSNKVERRLCSKLAKRRKPQRRQVSTTGTMSQDLLSLDYH